MPHASFLGGLAKGALIAAAAWGLAIFASLGPSLTVLVGVGVAAFAALNLIRPKMPHAVLVDLRNEEITAEKAQEETRAHGKARALGFASGAVAVVLLSLAFPSASSRQASEALRKAADAENSLDPDLRRERDAVLDRIDNLTKD